MISGIHKIARKEDLVINKRYEELSEVTAIIDPDKFPIFNLIDKSSENDWVSIWEYRNQLKPLLKKQLGFMLEIGDSRIEHHEAGKGVFLKLEDKEDVIVKGTLLGFVPGVIHNSFEPVDDEISQNKKTERRHITRYDGTTINYGAKLPYPFKLAYSLEDYNEMSFESYKGQNKEERSQLFVPGEFLNPYACGHFINHPPPELAPNVIFLDLIIPNTFFPQYLMRYLPYIKLSSGKENKYIKEYFHRDCYHGLGIFALENLKNDDELYVDYIENKLFSMEYRPDWLTTPPPLSPYLSKYEYENKLTFAAKIAAAFLISQNKTVFDQHLEKKQHNSSTSNSDQGEKFIKKKILEAQTKNK